jgi:protoporphyrinogen/coproporphyrinogen III oxidase
MKKVVIIGAGISGLSAAWFLKRRFGHSLEIQIFEKSSRPGGLIRTEYRHHAFFEWGPRGFKTTGKGKETLSLVRDLGLEQELIAARPESRKRYVGVQEKLVPFSFPFLLRNGLVKGIFNDLLAPKSNKEDETIADFTARRFHPKLIEAVMDPLAKGIFGGDARKLSMKSCFPALWEWEQKRRSIVLALCHNFFRKEKTPIELCSFRRGMEVLPKTLGEKLDSCISYETEVQKIDSLDADCIIMAISMPAMAKLLRIEDPCSYASLTCVHCLWANHVFEKKGYGFLLPSHEKNSILGMVWDSELFGRNPKQSQGCVMISGSKKEKEAKFLAQAAILKYMKVKKKPVFMLVKQRTQAIPQYTLKHDQRMKSFKNKLPERVIAIGTVFEGVGVNDCIMNARKCADGLFFE